LNIDAAGKVVAFLVLILVLYLLFATARKPDNVQRLVEKSRHRGSGLHYEPAIHDIEKAMRLEPSRAHHFLFLRHQWLAGLGRHEEALADVLEAIRLAPAEASYEIAAARLHAKLGKPEVGLTLLDDAYRARPDDLGLLEERARFLQSLSRFDEALRDISEGLRRGSNEARLWSLTGLHIEVLVSLGRLPEALDEASRWVKKFPDDPVPYHSRAKVFEAMGRSREADVARDQAMSIEHRNK
jgi:tetratricopeptide (TPR) repeat protein